MKITWTEYKDIIANKETIQSSFLELSEKYIIRGSDGVFDLEVELYKNPSDTTDLDDFVDNYKEIFSKPVVTRAHTVLGSENKYDFRPRATKFVATKNVQTNHDFLIDQWLSFRGGFAYVKNSCFGDYAVGKIVDKDDVLGYGATPSSPIEVKMYVNKWYIMPNVVNNLTDVDATAPIPPGLYFRIEYHSCAEATVDAEMIVNFLSYEV